MSIQSTARRVADGGDGSQAHPWSSLDAVLSGKWGVNGFSLPGYARPLLSSIPYIHIVNGKRDLVADETGNPPVHPGDTIRLMYGDYGDVGIGVYSTQVPNSDFVTVEAAPGQTPVFSTLYIRSTNKWVFNGIKVQSLWGANNNKLSLVTIGDQGARAPNLRHHPGKHADQHGGRRDQLDDGAVASSGRGTASGRLARLATARTESLTRPASR